MRFLFIAFSLTLFLVASALQINTNNFSPEATACINILQDLDREILELKDNLGHKISSTKNDSTILIKFLESKDSNEIATIDAGFQHATKVCKKVTSPSDDEHDVVTLLYNDVIKFTEFYIYRFYLLWKKEVEKIDAGKFQLAKNNLKELVRPYYRNYYNFEFALRKFVTRSPSDEVMSLPTIDYSLDLIFYKL